MGKKPCSIKGQSFVTDLIRSKKVQQRQPQIEQKIKKYKTQRLTERVADVIISVLFNDSKQTAFYGLTTYPKQDGASLGCEIL